MRINLNFTPEEIETLKKISGESNRTSISNTIECIAKLYAKNFSAGRSLISLNEIGLFIKKDK